mgnify:FL=1
MGEIKKDTEENVYNLTDGFFESLHDSKTLEYREGQHTIALDILDAIEDHSIILVEAGTGTGKSFGYLVPLIYSSAHDEKFKGFIISTSSLALQEQLKKDISILSEMLGEKIPVQVVKGQSNYLCEKRFEYFETRKENEKMAEIIRERLRHGKIEKQDFDDIKGLPWKKISVDVKNCENCYHSGSCGYALKRKSWAEGKAIICNHDYLISEYLKRDEDRRRLSSPSIIVFDEAHTLPEKFNLAYEKTISKASIESAIWKVYEQLGMDDCDDKLAIGALNDLFHKIRVNAKKVYNANASKEVEKFDTETTGFNCTKSIVESIDKVLKELTILHKYQQKKACHDGRMRHNSATETIETTIELLTDLLKSPANRRNVYWANFVHGTNERIEIKYLPKNLSTIIGKQLGREKCGIALTSASLTTKKNDYGYFKKDLGLDNITGKPVIAQFSQKSPYNYDANALLYMATDVISPKSTDRELYLDSLAKKIEELMDVTEGRSLVLFTAKKDMQDVYSRLKKKAKPYKILVQEEGKDVSRLKEEFSNDETSSLLATGAFWEGIDVKGSSLENVIIAKLPFPTVDPIIQNKASIYSDGFREVYLPEMLLKLKQGTGRLIRSETDKGIVAILDSRAKDYVEEITSSLPYSNVTAEMDEVKRFASTNLTKEKTSVQVKVKQ